MRLCNKSAQVFFFLKICIYVLERERESKHKQWLEGAEGEGEAGSLLSREPDPGLDPEIMT